MALEQITDHLARALARVTAQLKGTEFELLLQIFVPEVQALEDALFSLLPVIRSYATAEGVTLDAIGKLVGAEVRGTHLDAAYRLRIAAAIARNAATALPEQVIAIVIAFFPFMAAAPQAVILSDADIEGPACATIKPNSYEDADGYNGISAAEAEELMRYMSRAAGTRLIFSYAPIAADGANTLAKFDTASEGFDNTNQFAGSVDQSTRN